MGGRLASSRLRSAALPLSIVAAVASLLGKLMLTADRGATVGFVGHRFASWRSCDPAGAKRGKVAVKFFGGWFSDPKEEAQKKLKELQTLAAQEAEESMDKLTKANGEGSQTVKALQTAMSAVVAARATAVEAAGKAGGEKPPEEWPAFFADLGKDVAIAERAVSSAVSSAETTRAFLSGTIRGVESSSEGRAARVQEALKDYDEETQKAITEFVVNATLPVSEGELLRLWVLTKATLVDVERELRNAEQSGQSGSSGTLLKDMEAAAAKSKEAADQQAASKAKQAKEAEDANAAAAAAQKAAEASSSSNSSEDESPVPLLLGVAALAVAAYLAVSSGATKAPAGVKVPEMPKVPEIPKVAEITKSLPSMPALEKKANWDYAS